MARRPTRSRIARALPGELCRRRAKPDKCAHLRFLAAKLTQSFASKPCSPFPSSPTPFYFPVAVAQASLAGRQHRPRATSGARDRCRDGRLPSKSLDAPATMAASMPMLEDILLPSRALCRCALASSLPHSSAVLTPAGSVRSQRCSANGMAPPLPRTAGWARRPPACGVTARCRKAGRAGPPALAWRPCTLYHHVCACCVCPTGRSCVFAKNRHAWPHRGERRCFAFVSREGTPHTRACAQAVRAGRDIHARRFWPVLAVF
mgnify:CR=1 FL=1